MGIYQKQLTQQSLHIVPLIRNAVRIFVLNAIQAHGIRAIQQLSPALLIVLQPFKYKLVNSLKIKNKVQLTKQGKQKMAQQHFLQSEQQSHKSCSLF
jgi:hypothetical protein